jgi:hypothetical protein
VYTRKLGVRLRNEQSRAMASYGPESDTSSRGINIPACTAPIKRVQVDATMTYPEFSVLDVIPDETTADIFTEIGGESPVSYLWGMLLTLGSFSGIVDADDGNMFPL